MQSSQTHIPTSDFQEGILPVSTLEARFSVAELPFFNAALYAETRFSLRVGTGTRTGVSLSSWAFWRVCSFFAKKQPGGSLREREQALAKLSQKKSFFLHPQPAGADSTRITREVYVVKELRS